MNHKHRNKNLKGNKHKLVMPILFVLLTLVISVAVARTVIASSAGVVFYGKIGSVIAICTAPGTGNPCDPYGGLTTPYVVVVTTREIPPLIGIIPYASLGNSKFPVSGQWIVGFGAQTGPVFIANIFWMY